MVTGGEDDDASSPTRADTALHALDNATVWLERPVRRVVGSNRLNPLPHSGTISVFLLGVVIVSGLYITLFYEFGFEASYRSVAEMEDHAIQRAVRAIHRYSSAALVVTVVVHAWRILAAGRHVGRARRWRWATGAASLGVVWLAGVSGYWMVWDRRAAAISEVVIELAEVSGIGTAFAVRQLSGVSSSSGSTFMVVLWFVHLGLTAVIGWFTYRHLRNSKLAWLPPRHWMTLMGGALIAASLVFPVGMLGPARPDQVVADMPLDPFVLFLLPPLLSDYAWLAMAVFAIGFLGLLFLPRLLVRRDPAPVRVDEAACTGCELCVVDCPYNALTMRGSGADAKAVVAAESCVACGICVGSCAFGAIELPGWSPRPVTDVDGRAVVVTCDRHLDHGALGDADAVVVPVRCAGMMAPSAVRSYVEAGAAHVQLVGCAPGDCRYGTGNRLAAERLVGDRLPHTPRRYSELVAMDWVAPGGLEDAIEHPGAHPAADGSARPADRNALIGAGAVVALSIAGVAAATRAPFRTSDATAEVRVVVDHTTGRPLEGIDAPSGRIDDVEVFVDGAALESRALARSGSTALGVETWELDPGEHLIEVTTTGDDGSSVVFTDVATLQPEQRLVVPILDEPPPPGVDDGRRVFESRAAGCEVCHSTREGVDRVGPSLFGVADRAGDRVEGLDAAGYLRQSILLPDQYVVDGFPAGQMLPIYRERLSADELDALILYLLSLTAEEGS